MKSYEWALIRYDWVLIRRDLRIQTGTEGRLIREKEGSHPQVKEKGPQKKPAVPPP